mgnify:CR=1 FL=1
MIIFFVVVLTYAVVGELYMGSRPEPDRHHVDGQDNSMDNDSKRCHCGDGAQVK